MALEKMIIAVEGGERIKVLFNPNQIRIQKNSKWRLAASVQRDVPASQFTYGEPATLTMDLFFDTYEDRKDVREHTRKIFHLTTVEEHGDLHRPPLCKLEWGQQNFDDFDWVLQSLNQSFVLFLDDGTPVRATLGCTFRQWRSDDLEKRLLDPQSVNVAKTRIVRRGDTLSSIAGEEYNDTNLWRPIAEVNRIDNPRVLTPGQRLDIPALGPEALRKGSIQDAGF